MWFQITVDYYPQFFFFSLSRDIIRKSIKVFFYFFPYFFYFLFSYFFSVDCLREISSKFSSIIFRRRVNVNISKKIFYNSFRYFVDLICSNAIGSSNFSNSLNVIFSSFFFLLFFLLKFLPLDYRTTTEPNFF